MESHHQLEIIQAMKKPDFYPHPTHDISVEETHISTVFLTGNYVYKIKKPVELDFLDFTTLDSRCHYCHKEITLNRRLTDNVYLEVVSINLNNNQYCLNGYGLPVEYAVKMRQLPAECSMVRLLQRDKINAASINTLACVLSQFFKAAKTGPEVDSIGSWNTVRVNCEENFTQIQDFTGSIVDRRKFQIICSATRSFLNRRKSLFDRRILEGNIRDCHGDLRTGHIYFTDGGIQIIDCIEFNKRFRYGDIASDLAFLAMDIDFLGFSQTAHSLIKAYACYSDDPDIFTLLDFYKCYRAMVRVKVNCFRLQQNDLNSQKRTMLLKSTRRYLKLAYQYADNFVRPTLWIVFGMIATGKSTLAQEISERLDIKLFRSDVIRKELFTHETDRQNKIPFKEGIYSKHATSLVYGKLFLLAQEEIRRGNSAILDATFSSKDQRSEAFRLAENMDVNIVFVECKCRDATILKRLEKRHTETSVSDARPELFENLKNDYEAPDEIPPEFYIAVDTEESINRITEKVFSYIDLFGLGM